MATYIEKTDLEAFAIEKDALPSLQQDSLLESASRLFDNMCEVPEGFFNAAGAVATERIFYGDGTQYLNIDPFVGTIVSLDVDYGTPEYRVAGNVVIMARSQSLYWQRDEPVTIEARWGFVAIPADVKLAVTSLAIHLWRTADPASATLTETGEQVKMKQVPEITYLTAKKYREQYGKRFIFA